MNDWRLLYHFSVCSDTHVIAFRKKQSTAAETGCSTATCFEAATSLFFFFFYNRGSSVCCCCCLELIRSCSFCAVWNSPAVRVSVTFIASSNSCDACKTCSSALPSLLRLLSPWPEVWGDLVF